jgi:hypothetical protein
MRVYGLVFAGILCCSPCFADTGKSMPGSFQGASVKDYDVEDAACFATEKINQGKLVTIVSAHKQVVAGMNYDLVLQIKPRRGKVHTFEVRVFKPLPVTGEGMKLISVERLED